MHGTLDIQIQQTLGSLRTAPILPACCVCTLIRDETQGAEPERWVTQDHYHEAYGVNPSDCLLSHTYCPECFNEFMKQAA